ncbi:hypothetical protein J8J20_25495, partial [Mycobacterium tuberculosis]|nr:hypothetical protein [Mycobacterium tuberculosis]
QLDAIDARVEDLIEDAVRRAKSDPKPLPADLLSDVYVAYPWAAHYKNNRRTPMARKISYQQAINEALAQDMRRDDSVF